MLILRKHGLLETQKDVDAFCMEGRPAFLISSLTTNLHPVADDGAITYHVDVKQYDVALWRNKRKTK